jgi:hypothetical protein
MAQLNVDDEWFEDPLERRKALIDAMRSCPPDPEAMADGLALRAWRISRRFWRQGMGTIPEDVWARARLEPLIGAGLAERRPDGIYVRGSAHFHDYVKQRKDAGKSRAQSGQRDENGRFLKKGLLVYAGGSSLDHPPAVAGSPLDHPPAAGGSSLDNLQKTSSAAPAFLSVLSDCELNRNVFIETSANPQEPVYDPVDNDIPPPEPGDYGEPTPKPKPKAYRYSDRDLSLARSMHRKIAENPEAERLDYSDPEAWANELRLMQENDGVDFKVLLSVLTWMFGHAHWARTIQSPSGLRRNWATIAKQYSERNKGFGKDVGTH